MTPIRTIDKCDRTDTSQKQLDGNYPGRQEAMDHEKQAGSIAGVIEIVKYTFEISETRGGGGGGCAELQQVLLNNKTGCIVSERSSTRLGCDVDRE